VIDPTSSPSPADDADDLIGLKPEPLPRGKSRPAKRTGKGQRKPDMRRLSGGVVRATKQDRDAYAESTKEDKPHKFAPRYEPPGTVHVPTEKMRTEVMTLARVGVPRESIAALIGIDPKTLNKHYQIELAVGKGQGIYTASSKLQGLITKGNLKAIMFYLQAQAGWRTGAFDPEEGAPLDSISITVSRPVRQVISDGAADLPKNVLDEAE